jgi:hypothetical protein
MFEKLIKAAITLSPAIAPVAAAAGAAVAEFGALGVTGILALKGLKAELQGTGSEAQVTSALVVTLKESLNELSKTAAENALPGLAEATTKLRSDLPALNDEIGRQGRLLGDVASHLTGGLVGGFSTFGPVLDEVSGSVDRIAAKFEAWATGPGGAHLAKVLGDDYARVAPIIDDVAGAVVHLVSAAHASGLGILSELQLLARVVDDFPTPVLEGIIATFVSARTISAAVGAFNSVSGALQTLDSKTTKFALRQAAAAASTEAANAQVAASAAAEAAAVAESQAAVAAAYAASQREIAVATLGTETELTGLAAVSVQAAEEQAAAAALAAEAAVASAAEIGAAAETAAAESAAASEAAAFSWSAMLGPAGIVVGAVALLGLTFLGQGRDTQQATQDIRQYTDALVASNGVVTDGIRADIAKQLSQQGLITAAAKYGLTVRDLTDYVLGQGSAQGKVNAVLDAGWRATDKNTSSWHSFTDAAFKLGPGLTALKGNIAAATGAALAENEAMAGVSDTVTHQAGLLHTTASAYLDAKDAASKSTQQSRKQTLQWQIENNAGQLLAQTLDKLAGKKLSFAQAENQFQSQLVTLAQTLEQGSSALTGLSSDAIQNRSNLLQLVQGAEQTAEAFGNMKGSALAGRKELIKLRQQIIDNAVAHGEDRKEVEKYVDSVLKIPTRRGTEITLNDAKARAKARDLRNYLNSLHATVAVGASYKRGDPGLPGLAAGGGAPDGWFSVGEAGPELVHKSAAAVQVFSNSQSRAIVASTGMRAPGFAGGTNPGDIVTVSQSDNKTPKQRTKKGPGPKYTVAGQIYSSFQAAENAASRLFKADVQLGVKIDDKDLTAFRHALKGTVAQARSAFETMYADAKKLGISDALAKKLRVENGRIDAAIYDRNKAADRFKAITEKFNEVRSNVAQAGQGAFDITSAGTGYDGQQPVTGDNIEAQETQANNLITAWAGGIKKLARVFGKSATGKAMLQRLAEGGPSDYAQVRALLSETPKELTSLVSTQAKINKTSSDLGTFVGNELYGSEIKHLKAELKIDAATIDRLANKIGKQVEHAVGPLAHRPIEIKLGAEVVARASAKGTKINARRT